MNLEEYINEFLKEFLIYHHEINNLLFDNLTMYYKMCYFLSYELVEFLKDNEFEYDLNDFTKKSFYENLELLKKFCKEYNIQIDLNKLELDGTIEFQENDLNDYDLHGISNMVSNHKSVSLYNNGLIVDSAVLIHELSHLSNQPDNGRNQVSNLLTESLAFTLEFIYLDYLYKEGYKKDSIKFMYGLMKTFNYIINDAYPLLRLYGVYDKTGSLSEDNYKFIFKNADDYEEVLKEFEEIISKNQDEIFNVLWYVVASYLSIYMYTSYKKNNNFLDNINYLNNNLNNLNLEDALKIIGLECIDNNFYTEYNTNKIKESFEIFKSNYKSLKEECKKYHK